MTKLRINEVIVVEGKYDAVKLNSIVDTLIITTDGFAVFSNKEIKELIKRLGKERGLIILTDSDAAGFKIRNYINNFAKDVNIKNAFIPAVHGKETRKPKFSKEGILGVEGIDAEVIITALKTAGAIETKQIIGNGISYTDLYKLGISGTKDSADKRNGLLRKLGLPPRISKKTLCEVLSVLYTYEELDKLCLKSRPTLFWDFHGTITMPDNIWYTAALEAMEMTFPLHGLTNEVIRKEFYNSKMPWWQEDNNEKSLCGEAWWDFHNSELCKIYIRCGINEDLSAKAALKLKKIIMDNKTHRLNSDAIYVLSELQNRGYKQYLLSSNFPDLKNITDELNLSKFFEKIITSADIGYDKPSSKFYLKGLEIAGELPENSIMIGDNPINDIAAAQAVGMKTIAVEKGANSTQVSTWKCDKIIDILNILK